MVRKTAEKAVACVDCPDFAGRDAVMWCLWGAELGTGGRYLTRLGEEVERLEIEDAERMDALGLVDIEKTAQGLFLAAVTRTRLCVEKTAGWMSQC